MTERISHEAALSAVSLWAMDQHTNAHPEAQRDGRNLLRAYIQQQASESASSDTVSRAEHEATLNDLRDIAESTRGDWTSRTEAGVNAMLYVSGLLDQLTAQQAEYERVVGGLDNAEERHLLHEVTAERDALKARVEALVRIAKRTLACGQLEKLEDARIYFEPAPASPSPAVGEEPMTPAEMFGGCFNDMKPQPSPSPQVAQAAALTLEGQGGPSCARCGKPRGNGIHYLGPGAIQSSAHEFEPAQPAPGGTERCERCGGQKHDGECECECLPGWKALNREGEHNPRCPRHPSAEPGYYDRPDPTPSPALPGGLDEAKRDYVSKWLKSANAKLRDGAHWNGQDEPNVAFGYLLSAVEDVIAAVSKLAERKAGS